MEFVLERLVSLDFHLDEFLFNAGKEQSWSRANEFGCMKFESAENKSGIFDTLRFRALFNPTIFFHNSTRSSEIPQASQLPLSQLQLKSFFRK
jgi:hypothetical protein